MTAVWQQSACALARAVQSGERHATDIAAAFLLRIHELDGPLHAFLGVCTERALADAAAVDLRAGQPGLGPLAGVPIAWKDNLVRSGELATAGSRMLEHFVSPYTATTLSRLEAAGATLLGRTNLDEFGMGSSTENSAFGPTRNPWGQDLVPGGSSGGSAAAVAADLCSIAVGSDTGGSIRQPAALCGIAGLKPSYGRTSRYGLIAYASSLDCVGACARFVEDLALWLDVCGGTDGNDPTCVQNSPATTEPTLVFGLQQRQDLRGLRIGLPWQLNGPGIDDEVAHAMQAAIAAVRELGADVTECDLPSVAFAVPTYYLIAMAEASSNLARYDGVRYGLRRDGGGRVEAMIAASRSAGFGEEVQLRVLLGTFALSHGYQDQYYGQALRARERLRADFAAAFAQHDLLLCPTSPVPAFPLGSHREDPLAMYLCDALTVPASLCGLPALSQPCGTTANGLPIGMQWMAPRMRDDLVLQAAHVFERNTAHHLRRARP
jgi:aspartyl-tRNA(Asn)/glutamyl-tRNA(Gln) amidotransferase subunit A